MRAEQRVIAVVEDDPSMSRAVDRLLRAAGFEVHAFASAEQFLACPAPGAYGCLILDIRLPGMSGLDLHRALAADGIRLPAVFMTAHDEASLREQAARIENSVYLAKPFAGSTLLEAVTTVMRGDEGSGSTGRSGEQPGAMKGGAA